MKKIFTTLVVLLATVSLFAQVTGSGSAKLTVAYGGGTSFDAKADVGYTLKFPMLEGEGPLFSGNNLKVKLNVGASPIAVTGALDFILTPVAIAEVSLGGGAGTGWDFPLMNLEGLRIGPSLGAPLASDHLGGVHYFGRAGGALQFDTGAILSGDWSSILVRTYHELNYKGYTNATNPQAWEYEIGGAQVNGFNYKGEYILAYQMPLRVNLVGVQLESFVHNVFDSGRSDFLYDVSALANVDLIDNLSLLTVVQFTNYEKDDNSKVQLRDKVGFKRVALIASYSF